MPSQKTKGNNQNGNIELFELELTKSQLKALSSILPKGFSLKPAEKKSKHQEITNASNPTKKLFTNEGTQIVQKTPKPAKISREDILINKQALRDPGKRKPSTHYDYEYTSEATTSSKSQKINHELIRKCYNIVQKLKRHPAAGPFLNPVDVVRLGLRDYLQIVQEPMDISTVETKLKTDRYPDVEHFVADVRKIWNNSFLYNMKGSQIYFMTMEMSAYFEKVLQDLDGTKGNDAMKDLEKKVEMLSRQINDLHKKGLTSTPDNSLRMNRSNSKANRNAKLMEKPLTIQEKKTMGQNIKMLPPEHIRGVWDIVSQRMNLSGSNQEELEFDIESLPVDVARELERYIKNKISLINRGKNKAKGKELMVPREIQSNYSVLKQHEGEFEPGKGEDEVTTQHHSVIGSDGKPDSKGELDKREGEADSNSSESSFISDSDSDDDDKFKDKSDAKGSKSLQTQQELANFFAGSHGSMLNSFIVN